MTYSEATITEALEKLLANHGLDVGEFVRLGEADELAFLDLDLDFAYRALWPSLREPATRSRQMPPSLEEQSRSFAESINGVVNGAIETEAAFTWATSELGGVPTYFVMNGIVDDDLPSVHNLRDDNLAIAGFDEVQLYAGQKFIPNSTGQWLKTTWSQFALLVRSSTGWSPIIRLEVDETKDPDSWLAAHINVTGESEMLGYVWGVRGLPRRRLQSLHLPVGGFRYRPCLEDFLEFVIDEGMVPERPGWERVLAPSREEYRATQLRALVAQHEDIARDVLGSQPRPNHHPVGVPPPT